MRPMAVIEHLGVTTVVVDKGVHSASTPSPLCRHSVWPAAVATSAVLLRQKLGPTDNERA